MKNKVNEYWKRNQGNQDSSGNQKNVIQGHRPDTENRHTHQRTQSNQVIRAKINERMHFPMGCPNQTF